MANATFTVQLVHPNAPEVLRLVHGNVTANHRRRRPAHVALPGLVERARMIVDERRVMPVRVEKGVQR